MKITEIDKNMLSSAVPEFKDKEVYTIPHSSFDLYGVYYNAEQGMFCRMPQEIADSVSEGVGALCRHTAGGRVRFSTDAKEIIVSAKLGRYEHFTNFASIGHSGFILLEECADGSFWTVLTTKLAQNKDEIVAGAPTRGGMRNYILYFPSYKEVKSLSLGFDKGAKIENGNKYRSVKPILYYGSSITQGGCSARADASYQSIISKWNNIDFINLGFSGAAKGEDNMIDYLCTIDCSLFVCDYDHNEHTLEKFEPSHKKLYQKFRKTHPDTPILFLSAPDYEYLSCSKAKLDIIKKHYLDAKRSGDKKVYFYSGKGYFGNKDREICTVDRCHPNTLGMYLMAKKIYSVMKKIDKDFI